MQRDAQLCSENRPTSGHQDHWRVFLVGCPEFQRRVSDGSFPFGVKVSINTGFLTADYPNVENDATCKHGV